MRVPGLYKRGKTWWLTIQRDTKRSRISLKTDDELTAVRKAMEIRAEIERGGLDGAPAVGSWDAEIDAQIVALRRAGRAKSYYTELENRLKNCARAAELVGAERPITMTAAQAKAWQAGLEERKTAKKGRISDQTARAYAAAMARFFRVLVRAGKIRVSPFEKIALPAARPTLRRRFLSKVEAAALWKSAGDEWGTRFFLFCALHAGMRREEVIEARVHWFDVGRKLIHIQRSATWEPKDKDERAIPMTDEFAEFLRSSKLGGPQSYALRPDVLPGASRYRYDFRATWEALRVAAKVDCTFHDLRRTFASQLVSAGVSVYKVAKWLGDDVDVVQKHYGHLVAQDDEINRAWG